MEQKFTLEGTYLELNNMLQDEFGLSTEVARIAANIFILEQNKNVDISEDEQEEIWTFNGMEDVYETPLFKSRFTISFTQAKIDVFNSLAVPIVVALLDKDETITTKEIILVGLYALLKNTYRIKDKECCVYYQMLNYLKIHNTKWIKAVQAMPMLDEEKSCVHLDKEWNCPYRCGENKENCNINESKVLGVMKELCANNVLTPAEDDTIFSFKI